MTSEGLFSKIKKVVSQIPKGKVATYGQIAHLVGIADSRKVGWAVYGNQDINVPCHRVVMKDGTLAENFSLGGYKEQKKRLEEDGIIFEEEKKVNLEKYLWKV